MGLILFASYSYHFYMHFHTHFVLASNFKETSTRDLGL